MAKLGEILVVEDYEPDAQLLRVLFKRHRIQNRLHVVPDGAAALDFIFAQGAYAARASEPLPMVVILDIRLPKMDGWGVLQRLREHPQTKKMPVIMVSGSLFNKECETARQLGANACISKPVRIQDLHQAMTECKVAWAIAGQE